MRFVYCACAIKRILEDKGFDEKSSLDETQIIDYINKCQTYESGFSWMMFGESHSGLSYCALASLLLLNSPLEFNREIYIETLIKRQCGGF